MVKIKLPKNLDKSDLKKVNFDITKHQGREIVPSELKDHYYLTKKSGHPAWYIPKEWTAVVSEKKC
jgi:hypothetical protein